MNSRRLKVALAAVISLLSFADCTGNVEDTSGSRGTGGSVEPCVASGAGTGGSEAIPPTFATVKLVLKGGGAIMPCASAPCHGVGGMAPPGKPLTLHDDPDLYTNMTSYVSAACGNLKLVTPGKPDESALLKILKGPCGKTPRMPYMCSTEACIPDDYIAAIGEWIANCAPEK
jgi:hypothetical protein